MFDTPVNAATHGKAIKVDTLQDNQELKVKVKMNELLAKTINIKQS